MKRLTKSLAIVALAVIAISSPCLGQATLTRVLDAVSALETRSESTARVFKNGNLFKIVDPTSPLAPGDKLFSSRPGAPGVTSRDRAFNIAGDDTGIGLSDVVSHANMFCLAGVNVPVGGAGALFQTATLSLEANHDIRLDKSDIITPNIWSADGTSKVSNTGNQAFIVNGVNPRLVGALIITASRTNGDADLEFGDLIRAAVGESYLSAVYLGGDVWLVQWQRWLDGILSPVTQQIETSPLNVTVAIVDDTHVAGSLVAFRTSSGGFFGGLGSATANIEDQGTGRHGWKITAEAAATPKERPVPEDPPLT